MYDEINIDKVIEGINYMLNVVENKTGASPITASFLLSTVDKQNLNIDRFISKVDSKIYETAMTILYLLRHDYHSIIHILIQVVDNNEELLTTVSEMKGL